MRQAGATQQRGEASQFSIDRSHSGRWTITFTNPPINVFVPATVAELAALLTDLETDQPARSKGLSSWLCA